jgi:hypothetical protein
MSELNLSAYERTGHDKFLQAFIKVNEELSADSDFV